MKEGIAQPAILCVLIRLQVGLDCCCFSFLVLCSESVEKVWRKSGQHCVDSVEAKRVLPYP